MWNPGDGSDLVEGQDGNDILRFNGSDANEAISVVANGTRATLVRDAGGITMDLNGLEQIDLATFRSTDTVLLGDLAGTGITEVNIALAGTFEGGTGDAQRDTVVVTGTASGDNVRVNGTEATASVTGLAATVNITTTEVHDQLIINTQGGTDVVDASGLAAGVIGLQIGGGAGADTLIGSQGNDLFVWNPGDASDVVEGQDGTDSLLFNGNGLNEGFVISASGPRAQLSRDAGGVIMDLNEIEQVDVNALGGFDTITVNDLTGTDITSINLNLAAADGSGDAQPDTVIVKGTNGDDFILVSGDGGGVTVAGTASAVNIRGGEAAGDRLVVQALAGEDAVDASGLITGAIQLTEDGGGGDDILIGGVGDDVLLGGEGDDLLIGLEGTDLLDGGPGDNILLEDF